ncbi:MAG: MotA/TolQ/ExbB proton channel family protein [Planctomycetota bacterium]|nr:MotA/TolQ/ExbB proton channel family protein [Planctomycetota bacterium]
MNYFSILVWPGGGLIGMILWLLSVVMVAISVEYFISIRRVNILPDDIRDQVGEFFGNKQYREAIELTVNDPSLLSYMVHAALTEAANGYSAMERAMEEASEERTTKLLRHIEWLNLLGNIGPMLGLLGTVWGMIQAFFKIVEKGGMPDPKALAGSIGIALVTTLLGLGVAIPALSVYSIMRSRIDTLTSEAMVVSQELISNFRPGKKASAGS